MARKRIDENFLHKLFGIEINTNENKANYGTFLAFSKDALHLMMRNLQTVTVHVLLK